MKNTKTLAKMRHTCAPNLGWISRYMREPLRQGKGRLRRIRGAQSIRAIVAPEEGPRAQPSMLDALARFNSSRKGSLNEGKSRPKSAPAPKTWVPTFKALGSKVASAWGRLIGRRNAKTGGG